MTAKWILDLSPDKRDAALQKYAYAIEEVISLQSPPYRTVEELRNSLIRMISPECHYAQTARP